MTPKQERFVEEYLIDLNATAAYRRAGYKARGNAAEVSASQLLRNPKVAGAIQKAMDARSKRTAITADYVLGGLQEVAERCMQRAPVMEGRGDDRVQASDEEGRHVWAFDASGANKAFELLGKHLKLFTDKVEHSGEMRLNVLPEDAAL
ncbi:MAG: terminase small subunit [Pseudomonadota bacterium]|nr:terminase small subunit [Pseudomonadota bacterium]